MSFLQTMPSLLDVGFSDAHVLREVSPFALPLLGRRPQLVAIQQEALPVPHTTSLAGLLQKRVAQPSIRKLPHMSREKKG